MAVSNGQSDTRLDLGWGDRTDNRMDWTQNLASRSVQTAGPALSVIGTHPGHQRMPAAGCR
jgi:hypothetical protein